MKETVLVGEIVRVAKELIETSKTARVIGEHFDNMMEGRHMRFEWSAGRVNGYRLTEMPVPGKKRLTIERGNFAPYATSLGSGTLNMINVARGVTPNMTFDQASAAIKKGAAELISGVAGATDNMFGSWTEQVFYLEVEPSDMRPMKIRGRDFVLSVGWTEFKVYSPDSDFQQADPYYSGYQQASPSAARKLYKILKADPNALSGVGYAGLDNWFSKNGINTDTLNSVWH